MNGVRLNHITPPMGGPATQGVYNDAAPFLEVPDVALMVVDTVIAAPVGEDASFSSVGRAPRLTTNNVTHRPVLPEKAASAAF